MKHIVRIAIAMAALTAAFSLAQTPLPAEVQWKDAQHKEEVEGDLKGALAEYTKIAAGKDKSIAARALLRMAAIYTKLGDAEAKKVYERIVKDFPDQKDAVAEAKAQIALLSAPLPVPDPVSLAISPDGEKIVFAAAAGGQYQFWLQSLVSGTTRALPGTEGISIPFATCWSPDSKSFAFFGTALKRIDIDTGKMQNLQAGADSRGRGCSWSRTGTILYPSNRAIFQVSAQGGAASPATLQAPSGMANPHFLPDGLHFLYYDQGGGGVFVGQVGVATATKLFDADTSAIYSRSGHLLYVSGGKLYARGFDPAELKLAETATVVIADRVPSVLYTAAVSVSDSGTLVYRAGEGGNLRQFKWFDRTGKETGTVGAPTPVELGAPDLSPDGLSVAFDRMQDGNIDVWILELKTGKLTRFTSDAANDFYPIWSADGKTIFFSSGRTGRNELYEKPSDGSAPEMLAINDQQSRAPRGVSRDGRMLLIALTNTLIIQLDAIPRRESYFVTNGAAPQFSPDGQWIAYQSVLNPEVFIQQTVGGRRLQVSMQGGGHVRWRADGKELFYVDRDGKLMAVPIELAPNGQDARIGDPAALFTPPMLPRAIESPYSQQYSVAADGQHFLIATVPPVVPPMTVIRNWQPK